MTSQGVLILDTDKLRQTTVRVPPDLLRKARFYLDEEGKSIQEFLADQLAEYVRKREKKTNQSRTTDCA